MRQNIFRLRKELERYYSAKGANDTVQISLPVPGNGAKQQPRGQAYKLLFAYNRLHPAAHALNEAKLIVQHCRLKRLPEAITLAEQALLLPGQELRAHSPSHTPLQ